MRRPLCLVACLLLSCAAPEPGQAVPPPSDETTDEIVLRLYDVRDIAEGSRSYPGEDINLVPSGGCGVDIRGLGDAGDGVGLFNLTADGDVRGRTEVVFPKEWDHVHARRKSDLTLRLTNFIPPNLVPRSSVERAGSAEEYDAVEEGGFLDPRRAPLSTFSIDVDTASMSNVRRILSEGRLPPAGAVRIEEMVNYFSYDYPEPDPGMPFSVTTEVAECPWNPAHRLVHIGIQGRRIDEGQLPPRNLVFLLDVSGSMDQSDKLPLVKGAMKLLAERLTDQDRVAIVVYAGASGVVLEPTSGGNRAAILDALDRLEAGGSTNGGEGIRLAYALARQSFEKGALNRVILATDGDFNVGTTGRADLNSLIEKEREGGIQLTVLGVGGGNLKDSQMEMLADKGNGNYAYLDSMAEARKVLVSEAGGTLVTIAADVKIQVEFNPERVGSYRLVGYENRRLADRDFNDDTKDAGEIGAGHSVTALYEISPPGERPAPDTDPLKYQDPGAPAGSAFTDEVLTLKLRYKMPGGSESRLVSFPVRDPGNVAVAGTSPDFRFSAAVAAFGLLLRGSDHRGDATFEQVKRLAHGALGEDPHGYRRGFLQVVGTAEALTPSPDDD